MDKTQSTLLKKWVEYLQDKIELEKTGEGYNMFDIVTKGNDELMHSKVLASLLDPHGPHKQDTKFLDLFLKHLPEYPIQTSSTRVKCEYAIGEKRGEKMSATGGRIDIFLEDSAGHKIMIENKWDAGDQEYQLVRYHNYDSKALLIYLTRDGHEPSDISRGELSKGKDYCCISYDKDILKWLKECSLNVYDKPAMYVVINSYIYYLQKLNMIYDSNAPEFKNIEEINAAFEISEGLREIKKSAQIFFWKELFNSLNEIDNLEPNWCFQSGNLESSINDYVLHDASRDEYRRYGIKVKVDTKTKENVYFAIFLGKELYFPLYSDSKEYNEELSKRFTEDGGWEKRPDSWDYSNICLMYPKDNNGNKYDFVEFKSEKVRKLAIKDKTLIQEVFKEFTKVLETIKMSLS